MRRLITASGEVRWSDQAVRLARWPVRSTGLLLRAGAAGGALHDVGRWVQHRYPARRIIRPMAASAALTGGVLWWGGRRMAAREAAVKRWALPQTSPRCPELTQPRPLAWSRG